MQVSEVVGVRMKDMRESRKMTQEQFGELLGELLGKAWPRQAVSAAERGLRAFTAAEIFAIALVLGVPPGHLFTPVAYEPGIELGPGVVVDVRKALQILLEGHELDAARETLTNLLEHAVAASHSSARVLADAKYLIQNLGDLLPEPVPVETAPPPAIRERWLGET